MAVLEAINGFTVERLRTFCWIAQAGSIAMAARGDPTRQSQFSRQIKELEQCLGLKLVERTGKTISLTEHGRKLAVLTQGYFQAVEDLRTQASRLDVLRIGGDESVFRWLWLPRLTSLQAAVENLRFEFVTRSTSELIDEVKAGRLHAAIMPRESADDEFLARPCGVMKFALIVPRAVLPDRTAAGLQLLSKLPVAMLSNDLAFAKQVQRIAEQANLKLDVQILAQTSSLVLSAVQNSRLAAVLPEAALSELSKETYAAVPLNGLDALTRDLVTVFLPQNLAPHSSIHQLASKIAGVMSSTL